MTGNSGVNDWIPTLTYQFDRPWLSQAECSKMVEKGGKLVYKYDIEDFYPTSCKIRAAKKALAACSICPVLSECRNWIIETEETLGYTGIYGVYGGMTERERRELFKERYSD